MYLDKGCIFSEGQAVAAGVSDNAVDFGKSGDGYEAPWLVVCVSPALEAGKSIGVDLECSETEDFSAVEVVASYKAKGNAPVALAERVGRGCKRFCRLRYTPDAGVSGSLTAFLSLDVPSV